MKRFLVLLSAVAVSLFSFTVAAQNVLNLSFGKGGKFNIPGGMWIESKTPCLLEVTMEDGKVSEIAVYPKDASTKEVELITNKPLHMADNRVTTIWDDELGQETLIVRLPGGEKPVERFKIQDGPITSDEKFFSEVLNLDYPGLGDVKKAVAAKDWTAARTAYVKYLKTRKTPVWFFDWRDFDKASSRDASYDRTAADKIASNLLESCLVPYQYKNHVNWSINPTEPYYVEWTWQLSRHGFWGTLGKAYWATGDEKYAKAFVRQLRGWIIDNPLPSYAANDQYSRWRTIETGIRTLGVWPEVFFRFLGSPSFDDESIVMMVKSFYEHGVHLETFPSRTGNWLTMEMNGLYHTAVVFPEFKDSPRWEEFSSNKLYEEEKIQIYPDGAQIELTPHYHGVTLNNLLGIYPIAKINDKKLPAEYISNLEKAYEYYVKIRFPNGRCPALNDADWDENADAKLKDGLSYFPDRKDFLYAMTGGTEGTKPAFTSVWMPWAGWYNMRSGFDPQALHAHFEVGPFSAGHSHEDKLSLTLMAYGDMLMSEGGNYPYDVSQWRKYVLSPRAHNISKVDGKEQNRGALRSNDLIRYSRKPMTNRWISNDKFDFGEGWYDEGFGPKNDSTVTQYRALVFLKDKCWLLFDIFTPKDKAVHKYESTFHLDSPDGGRIAGLGPAVMGKNPGHATLAMVPLHQDGLDVTIVNGQDEPAEVQGWVHRVTYSYSVDAVATPVFKREAAGQVVEPYLLWPVKAGEECPVSSVKSAGEGNYTVSFKDGSVMSVKLKVSGNSLGKLSYTIKGGKAGSVSAKVL